MCCERFVVDQHVERRSRCSVTGWGGSGGAVYVRDGLLSTVDVEIDGTTRPITARNGGGLNESFTVRKISYGEGVERVFPMYSPLVEAVEVVRRGKVRRAKLYYLRDLRGKSARIVEKTNVRAKALNDIERQAFLAEKARLEAEKIAAVEALALEKAAEEKAAAEAAAAEAKAAAAAAEEAPKAE